MSNERRWEYAHKRWDAEISRANAIKWCGLTAMVLGASIYLSILGDMYDPLLIIVPAAVANIIHAVRGDER